MRVCVVEALQLRLELRGQGRMSMMNWRLLESMRRLWLDVSRDGVEWSLESCSRAVHCLGLMAFLSIIGGRDCSDRVG